MATQKGKPGQYREIERKFDVVESTVSPSFDGMSAVTHIERLPTQSLDAVYVDTAGHDLARNQITLRRRTGDPEGGWHLKLPADGDTRIEMRAPLTDSDAVPDELRDVVAAIVRDRPLVPVANVCTTRDVQRLFGPDGTAIAEFCDDRVRASAGPDTEQQWREWELELAGNLQDNDLLDRFGNRLRDAGATPAGHGSKLARVLASVQAVRDQPAPADPIHRAVAEQVAQLIRWDCAARTDTDDSVHQMRVSTRKLRSLLKESEGSFGLTDDAWVLDELRQLAAILGVARDAEVLAGRYRNALEALPAELVRGPVRKRLVDGARRRYDAGLRQALAEMRTPRYFRLLDALDDLATAEPMAGKPGEAPAPVTIDAAYKRVRRASETARQAEATEAPERDEALHRIRKSAKRLRYTAAATGAVGVSKAARTIQALLGDHQDSVVSRTHLRQQAETAQAAGEDTFTYGLLYSQEEELAREARRNLTPALQALAKAVRKAR